jgi:hypothetical protein
MNPGPLHHQPIDSSVFKNAFFSYNKALKLKLNISSQFPGRKRLRDLSKSGGRIWLSRS